MMFIGKVITTAFADGDEKGGEFLPDEIAYGCTWNLILLLGFGRLVQHMLAYETAERTPSKTRDPALAYAGICQVKIRKPGHIGIC